MSGSQGVTVSDLQAVDEFLLDGVLRRGVGGDPQPLGRLPQTLLLVLVLRVRRRALTPGTGGRTGQEDRRTHRTGHRAKNQHP